MNNYLTCFLAAVFLVSAVTFPVAGQESNIDVATLERVKSKIAKLGVGEKAKATVTLKNGKKIKGYVGQAGNDEFVLRDRKTDAPTTIRFSDVSKVESNRGHSTARNIAIGVAIGVGAFLAIIGITIAHLD